MNSISTGVSKDLYNEMPDYVRFRTKRLNEAIHDTEDDFKLESIIETVPPPSKNCLKSLFSAWFKFDQKWVSQSNQEPAHI